jgi:hypothetical protein
MMVQGSGADRDSSPAVRDRGLGVLAELEARERIVSIEARSGGSEHDWTIASGAMPLPRQVPARRGQEPRLRLT